MRFNGSSTAWFSMFMGRTRYDYAREIGDGSNNSIVMACVLWICRNFPEAPVRVSMINRKGEVVPDENHELKLLLDTPNSFYPGELLWSATLADRTISGNAYWLKVRSAVGRVVELWWIPSTMIEPKWPDDGSVFISHYEYRPGPDAFRIETQDIVHFRYHTFDPRNMRKGISPIRSLAREIFTDDEAANYTAAMLRNVGVPPVVISPGVDASPTQEELEQTKQRYQEVTTGDARGQALIMSGPTQVTTLGFNPQQMDVGNIRNVPEERVTAALGLQAAVIGLGTGLQNTKVGATMAEMREACYENNLIPTQRLMASELRTQLVPEFGDVRKLKLDFDLSKVRVLQDDQNELHARARENLNAGLWTLNRALEEVGDEPMPDGDVYYIPHTVTVTNPDELISLPEPVAALPAAGETTPPPPKMLRPVSRKAIDEVGQDLERLRLRAGRRAERKIGRLLAEQRSYVLSRLVARKDTRRLINPDNILPPDSEQALKAALEETYQAAYAGVHDAAEGAVGDSFDVPDALLAIFLAKAGERIQGIDRTTRAAVREALEEGTAASESLDELTARIAALPEFEKPRAKLIARTELAAAIILASTFIYQASGRVQEVLLRDGDFDAECAARNGRRMTLAEASAEPPLLHPNCTAVFLPIIGPSEVAA